VAGVGDERGNSGVSWRAFGRGELRKAAVLCSEPLGWLLTAQLSSLRESPSPQCCRPFLWCNAARKTVWHLLTAVSCIFLLSLLLPVAVSGKRSGSSNTFSRLGRQICGASFQAYRTSSACWCPHLAQLSKVKMPRKMETCHCSLKKRTSAKGDMDSQSLSLEIVGREFFLLVWFSVFYPESAIPLILASSAHTCCWADPVPLFRFLFFYS